MALYAFDGTWNQQHDAGEYGRNTNVIKFREAYTGTSHFYKGVGTRLGWLGKVLGGAFGAGGKQRLAAASLDLSNNILREDQDIDIIGFSRGAALALAFANHITTHGVAHPTSGSLLFKRPRIRFLGLWDVVAAFGIPIDIGIPFNRINLGYRLDLPRNVDYCFHALALDERRQAFRPTRIHGAHEVWFRGVHSDVGGGNDNPGLNHIALRWMLCKAIACGLPVRSDTLVALDTTIDTDAAISTNFDPVQNAPRAIGAHDLIHYSVRSRPGAHVNPPTDCPMEDPAGERHALHTFEGGALPV